MNNTHSFVFSFSPFETKTDKHTLAVFKLALLSFLNLGESALHAYIHTLPKNVNISRIVAFRKGLGSVTDTVWVKNLHIDSLDYHCIVL